MHQTEIRRSWTSLCKGGGSDSTDSGSEESQLLPLVLCLRHLTRVGGEEEEVVVEGGWAGCQRCPLPLLLPSDRSPSMSLPKHSSLALKLADSASSLSELKHGKMTWFNRSAPFMCVCVCVLNMIYWELKAASPLACNYCADTGYKWCSQHKIAVLVTWTFWLWFHTSGDRLLFTNITNPIKKQYLISDHYMLIIFKTKTSKIPIYAQEMSKISFITFTVEVIWWSTTSHLTFKKQHAGIL